MKWTDRIGRRVKLRDLHIALAEAGSMTRATEELAVSYPVVSRTISELEHTLGVKLLDPSISGVEPTRYGRRCSNRELRCSTKCGTAFSK
jgi:molybdenum-dependent DNA-binding transcriptional regulator ModE